MNRWFWLACIVVLLVPTMAATVSSVGWLADWDYRKGIDLSNSNSADLSYYQMGLSIDTQTLIAAGKMRADCGDLRFTDQNGLDSLSYWLESGCNTSQTRLWVKVPLIAASDSTKVYLYYGNPTASDVSSGNAVFSLFDHFTSNTLGDQWQTQAGSSAPPTDSGSTYAYISIVNSSAVVDSESGYNFISKDFRAGRPFIAEMQALFEGPFAGEGRTLGILYYAPDVNLSFNRQSYQAYVNETGACLRYGNVTSHTNLHPFTTTSPATDTWYVQRLVVNSTTAVSAGTGSAFHALWLVLEIPGIFVIQ